MNARFILGGPKKQVRTFSLISHDCVRIFDTLNMKIITNKFLINFEKMAVRRGLSKFLHGLKVDAISEWVNRV